MGREKNLNDIIQDATREAQAKVNTLQTQTQTLTFNLKELEERRNKLSQEIIELSVKFEKDNQVYKNEIDQIMKTVQEKLANANTKETQVVNKLAELTQKQKESEDLIKSNQGLQKNLILQTEIVKANISVLEGLVVVIEKTLKDIK